MAPSSPFATNLLQLPIGNPVAGLIGQSVDWAKQKKGKARMKELGRVSFDTGSLKQLLKGSKNK